jgi:hypothetical protein
VKTWLGERDMEALVADEESNAPKPAK